MDVKKVGDSVQLSEHLKQVTGQKPQAPTSRKAAGADTAAGGDTLAISAEAQEKAKIANYVRMVREMPDIRPDKVAEAKRKLAAGEYDLPGVAEKIAALGAESVVDSVLSRFCESRWFVLLPAVDADETAQDHLLGGPGLFLSRRRYFRPVF